MFGGSKPTQSKQKPQVLSLRITQSAFGQVIPVIIGTQRVSPKLLWEGDFKSIAHDSQTNVGGKGGGGGGTTTQTSYTYEAALQMLLCEGGASGVAGLLSIWDTKGYVLLAKGVENYTVPGGGGTYTVTQAANFYADWGCTKAVAYSVNANDFGSPGVINYSGTQQSPMTAVGGAPGAGQYHYLGSGQYQFSAADAGIQITITYNYAVPNSVNNGLPLSQLGLTFFKGTRPQSAWTYMTTNHPSQALDYTGLCHVDASTFDLGSSGSLPNYSYEVAGLNIFGGGILDANPRDAINTILLDQFIGAAWSAPKLDTMTGFSNYCVANGIFISHLFDSQRTLADWLKEIAEVGNAEFVWTQGVLKCIPYGDTTAIGNGAQYTPNTQPIYNLQVDDFAAKPGQAPITIIRTNVQDAENSVSIEILNRANNYNPEIVEEKNQGHINVYGLRKAQPRQYHGITSIATGQIVANTILKRNVYIRATYKFKLDLRYFLLDPMDLVTLTLPALGLNQTPARILSIDDLGDGYLDVTAEEFPWGTATPTLYGKGSGSPYAPNAQADPGNINAPIVFEPSSRLTNDLWPEVWFGGSGGSQWGGAHVWVSTDNVTYKMLPNVTIQGPLRQGVLTSTLATALDPDTTNTLAVDLTQSAGQLVSGTQLDADNYRTLCIILDALNGSFELLDYETATLTSAYHYNLTYLRRGLFGTNPASHSGGAQFARLDDTIAVWRFDPSMIGKQVWFKFTSFNFFGLMEQNVANVTAYQYTLTGAGAAGATGVAIDELIHTGTSGTNDTSSRQISSATYTTVSGDYLEYDVFIDPSSTGFRAAIMYEYGGGHTLPTLTDQNSLGIQSDLNTGNHNAVGQWYHRKCSLGAGQAINTWATYLQKGTVGSGYMKAAFANVRVTNGTTLKLTVFSNGLATPIVTAPAWSYEDSGTWTGVLVYTAHNYPKGFDPDQINPQGNVPPNINGSFAYTSTTTSITFYWDGTHGSTALVIYLDDGTTIIPPYNSFTVTGLTANTTYYFYPIYNPATGLVGFVTGGAGSNGSPACAYSSASYGSTQQQFMKNVLALSNGSVTAATPASGSGGGGGLGGGGQCVRSTMLVRTSERGDVAARDVLIGEKLVNRHGTPRVSHKSIQPCAAFVRFTTSSDRAIEVSPREPVTVIRDDGEVDVRAQAVRIDDLWISDQGIEPLKRIEIVRDSRGEKVLITVDSEDHTFFAGETSRMLLIHNVRPNSS